MIRLMLFYLLLHVALLSDLAPGSPSDPFPLGHPSISTLLRMNRAAQKAEDQAWAGSSGFHWVDSFARVSS